MKQIYLFISATLFSLSANAQAPDWEWVQQSGGITTDNIFSIAADNNGNIYAVGMYYSETMAFGNLSITNAGMENTRDGFFVKYNNQGQVQWVKNLGGLKQDEIRCVTTDIQGNIYIGGTFESEELVLEDITLINTNPSTYDMFIAKYNSAGEVIWAKNAAGDEYEYVNAVTTDSDGNIFIAGVLSSPLVTFGAGVTASNTAGSTTHDVYIAKYDSNGNALWVDSAGGSTYDEGVAVKTDSDGNVYFVGKFYSAEIVFGDDTLENFNNYGDIFIAKYDSDGEVQWTAHAGGNNYDDPHDIAIGSDGYFYLSGSFKSGSLVFGDATLTNTGEYDAFLVKYDTSDGEVIWAKSVVGDGLDRALSVVLDSEGDIYTAGFFGNFGSGATSTTFGTLPELTTNGTGNSFVAKYDPNGNAIWVKANGGTGSDESNHIAIDNQNMLYIAGTQNSPTMSFDDTTLNQIGFEDPYVGKIDLGILSIQHFTASNVSVYPNPVHESLTIMADALEGIAYTIADNTGRIVSSGILANSNNVPVSNLASGLYILATANGLTAKFIKE